jgi:hypothetical protein
MVELSFSTIQSGTMTAGTGSAIISLTLPLHHTYNTSTYNNGGYLRYTNIVRDVFGSSISASNRRLLFLYYTSAGSITNLTCAGFNNSGDDLSFTLSYEAGGGF